MGWYIHVTYLHNDFSESHYIYGPYGRKYAWRKLAAYGREYFVYRTVKFHWRKSHVTT